MDQILTILASSMLVVTTFSLSIAVSAFSAASNTATPRATALLQEDPTTQNVLATFLGAFLFSLIGLIALRSDIYERAGRMLLFLATLVVVVLVIIALLRWISHIMAFGRMDDTLDRVEQTAAHSLEVHLNQPCLAGQPLYGAVPQDAVPVLALNTGYIQHIDVNALAECAEAIDAELYIDALPGSFVHEAANMLYIRGAEASEDQMSELRHAFTLGKERTFSQDPRFGVIVLSEIASRALSSAVNDPGTAISVIGRLVRILSSWTDYTDSAVDYPAVHVPPVLPADIMYDASRPIARDAAALVEVQIRLHKALKALGHIVPRNFAPAEAQRTGEYASAPGSSRAEPRETTPVGACPRPIG